MTSIALPRKIFQGVAKRADMFRMFDRHAMRPDRFAGDQSAVYAGEWLEIDETSYSYMLDILPPLWMPERRRFSHRFRLFVHITERKAFLA